MLSDNLGNLVSKIHSSQRQGRGFIQTWEVYYIHSPEEPDKNLGQKNNSIKMFFKVVVLRVFFQNDSSIPLERGASAEWLLNDFRCAYL